MISLKALNKYESEVIVFKNFFYLALMKLSNVILPLLILPYLIRVVGVEFVGSINLASTVMLYLGIIVSYSYNFIGTKYITENITDEQKLCQYYSIAMIIRLWLLLLSFFILIVIVYSVDNFHNIMWVCFFSFGSVVAQFLTPTWIFQGFQHMKYITCIDLISKLISTSLIFIFVRDQSDFLLVPIFTSFGLCTSGIISILLIKERFNLKISYYHFFNFKLISNGLREGKDIFLQQIYVSIYGPMTILFLGGLSGSLSVGYYTIAEKIVGIPLMIITIAVQAYYPYALNIYSKSKDLYYSQIIKVISSVFVIMIISSFILYFKSKEIYLLVAGKIDCEGLSVFNILVFSIAFGALGQLLTQVFVTTGNIKKLRVLSFYIMLITLFSTPVIIMQYNAIGLAYYTLLRQVIVIGVSIILILKQRNEFNV